MPELDAPVVDVWVGLDVGKGAHYATALNAAGETLWARPVANEEVALTACLRDAAAHGAPALVIDQPGSIGHLAIAVAAAQGTPVAYVPGLVMRRAADLYPGEAKTDPKDSFVLADTARTHHRRVHWLEATDELLLQLRILAGYDEDLAHDATRVMNRLRDALTSVAPALERALGDRLRHPAVQALLARYATPTALRAAGPARVRRRLVAQAPRVGVALATAVQAALEAQTVTVPGEATMGGIISDLAANLNRLARRREQLEVEMEQVFRAHPFGPVLLTMPGVGTRTGARILAEVGDGHQFPTPAHLASYAGLAPVTRQSGSSVRGELRSRRGNHRLKNALFLTAFASRRSSPESQAYYDRKRAEGKRHNAAVVCLARRRCDVLHAMLRSGQPYRPSVPSTAPAA